MFDLSIDLMENDGCGNAGVTSPVASSIRAIDDESNEEEECGGLGVTSDQDIQPKSAQSAEDEDEYINDEDDEDGDNDSDGNEGQAMDVDSPDADAIVQKTCASRKRKRVRPKSFDIACYGAKWCSQMAKSKRGSLQAQVNKLAMHSVANGNTLKRKASSVDTSTPTPTPTRSGASTDLPATKRFKAHKHSSHALHGVIGGLSANWRAKVKHRKFSSFLMHGRLADGSRKHRSPSQGQTPRKPVRTREMPTTT